MSIFCLLFQLFVVYLRLVCSDVSYYQANTLNFYMTYDGICGADCRAENEKHDKGINCCHNINGTLECTATDSEGKCFGPESKNTSSGNYDLQINFTYAQNICESNGYRLCTMNEVIALCDTSACNLNQRGIWTKNTCSPWYWQRKSGSNLDQCVSGLDRSGAVKCVNGTFDDCIAKYDTQFFHVIYGYQKEENTTYLEAVAICNEYGRRLPNYNESLKGEDGGICHNLGLNKKFSWTTDTCSYTLNPSTSPTPSPSRAPTSLPTSLTNTPTLSPSINPSIKSTNDPTYIPSSHPSRIPSLNPSTYPSETPTVIPSSIPSMTQIQIPTIFPSEAANPTNVPTNNPSNIPSITPPVNKKFNWTTETCSDTLSPSTSPIIAPSGTPTFLSDSPTMPTLNPSNVPSTTPTSFPSLDPTQRPTKVPSSNPTNNPSLQPTNVPSSDPSKIPSLLPSNVPSITPTQTPSEIPSVSPSDKPSIAPSNEPSTNPSVSPTNLPSNIPSITPTSHNDPTTSPSKPPTSIPSTSPTENPTNAPSTHPSTHRSKIPSTNPTLFPSTFPTINPTNLPSVLSTQTVNKVNGSKKGNLEGTVIIVIVLLVIFLTITIPLCYLYKKTNKKQQMNVENMQYIFPSTSNLTMDKVETPALHIKNLVTDGNVTKGKIEEPEIENEQSSDSHEELFHNQETNSDNTKNTQNIELQRINNDGIGEKEPSQQQLAFTNEGELELDYSSVETWTINDVCKWLVGILDTNEYNQLFKKNSITGNSLLYLTSDDLVEIGVTKVGHKRIILTNIQKLRNF